MKILITGANGFVGRTLVSRLAGLGHEVVGLDVNCDGLENQGAAKAIPGDLGDPAMRGAAIKGCEALIHLATVPGGAAEVNPAEARRINVDAAMALSEEFAAQAPGAPFVAASSIGIIGQPFPPSVDDTTSPTPYMYYGAHKAMMEIWLGALARRGELATLSLRLPGIVARPAGSVAMKSAFMSNVFHALRDKHAITLPVSPDATLWLMSVDRVTANFVHALHVVTGDGLPESRAVTLPAIRLRMADLVAEIARQTGADPSLARYEIDPAMEEGFGSQPPLETPTAEAFGFAHDGDLAALVSAALAAAPQQF